MFGTSAKPIPHEAALIVPVPEAEPVIGQFRLRYDPSAVLGVPAHVTINYPFHPHFGRPADAHGRLEALAAGFPAFDFRLSRVASFPDVIYLVPEPKRAFLALIKAVAAAFPEFAALPGAV